MDGCLCDPWVCVDSFVFVQCLLQIDKFYRTNTKSIYKNRSIFFSFRIFLAITYCLSPYLYDTNFSEPINVEIRFVLRFVSLLFKLFFYFYKNTVFFVISTESRNIKEARKKNILTFLNRSGSPDEPGDKELVNFLRGLQEFIVPFLERFIRHDQAKKGYIRWTRRIVTRSKSTI